MGNCDCTRSMNCLHNCSKVVLRSCTRRDVRTPDTTSALLPFFNSSKTALTDCVHCTGLVSTVYGLPHKTWSDQWTRRHHLKSEWSSRRRRPFQETNHCCCSSLLPNRTHLVQRIERVDERTLGLGPPNLQRALDQSPTTPSRNGFRLVGRFTRTNMKTNFALHHFNSPTKLVLPQSQRGVENCAMMHSQLKWYARCIQHKVYHNTRKVTLPFQYVKEK